MPSLANFPKAKAAKVVRSLFDMVIKVQNKTQDLVELSMHIIDWCEKESRSFLRMRIEIRLSELYFELEKFNDAIKLLDKLLYELKRKEDK